jgi:hypothetical protein
MPLIRIVSAASTAAILVLLAVPAAHAASCVNGVYRAGCVGPNGTASANKTTGQTHSTTTTPSAGTSATGIRGNTVTKAAQPGCAYVNGRRVCN